jgi:uncharacterized protein (TIGR04255 family)
MTTEEIFPNPTVKQVVFQVRYPELFFLEGKIGDLQMRIMDEFPESSLFVRRQLLLTDIGPEKSLEDLDIPPELQEGTRKVWVFKSPKGYDLSVLTDSWSISSLVHKTWNQGDDVSKTFRYAIGRILTAFQEVTQVPKYTRVGLRYIDDCPLPPTRSTLAFNRYYQSTLPLQRFSLEDAVQLSTTAVVARDGVTLRFAENVSFEGDEPKMTLDFDASATEVPASNCLDVADQLHRVISAEYKESIKDPVKKIMRRPANG